MRFLASVYIIPFPSPKFIINCVINATRTTLLGFYIFKAERIWIDFIQLCKLRTCMAMQSKASMTTFLFKEFLSFFKRSIPNGISLINKHLLIFDDHGSHVTLEAIEQSISIWVGYGYLTFTNIPCTTAFTCSLLQTFQNYF